MAKRKDTWLYASRSQHDTFDIRPFPFATHGFPGALFAQGFRQFPIRIGKLVEDGPTGSHGQLVVDSPD